jgi:di- and tripeptidase
LHVSLHADTEHSAQWISLASLQAATERSGTASVPIVRPHKFFDSGPHGGGGSQTRLSASASSTRAGTPVAALHTPPLGLASSPAPAVPRRGFFERASTSPDVSYRHAAGSPLGSAASSPGSSGVPLLDTSNVRAIQLPTRNMLPNAHHGYVYALELLPPAPGGKPLLVSGSGDEDIKLWICTPDGLIEHGTLHHSPNGVLALAAWDRNTLFAGLQGGEVEVWDVETARVVRSLPAHSDDVLALLAVSMPGQTKCLFSASADGSVRKWDASFKCVTEWRAHQDAIVLSLASLKSTGISATLLTGASDNLIKIWDVPVSPLPSGNGSEGALAPATAFAGGDPLLSALAQFVSFRSVSAQETLREDCRQCAHWLKAHLSDLGAETSLLAGAEGRNPLVLATFRACGSSLKPRRRVVAYAHYDVVAPGATERWTSDPWTLAGRDGYLFARGVSDNKGPCLAIAHATAELMKEGKLETDVVLLVEGEEEAGGSGFLDAVRRARDQIGDVVSDSAFKPARHTC